MNILAIDPTSKIETVESWFTILDYKDIYEINKFGIIKSLARKDSIGRCVKNRLLKPTIDTHGYHNVKLYKNGKSKTCLIHTLMAITFFGYVPDGKTSTLVVDHINNIKTDNAIENLQLVSNRVNGSKDRFRKNYTSKYVGVHWSVSSNKWCATILINKKRKFLGYYKLEIDAHKAYNNELKKINSNE